MRPVTMRRAATAAVTALLISLAHATTAGEAFGSPGVAAMHGPAQKSFLGTALSPFSQIYFTGYRGIVSEVYYPVLDTTETVDLQFLVGDEAGTFVDEEKLASYSATQTDPRTMSWQVATGNAAHDWHFSKTVYTDPKRNHDKFGSSFEPSSATTKYVPQPILFISFRQGLQGRAWCTP